MKVLGSMLLLIGMASFPMAQVQTPEVSPASAVGALALISGGLLVMRGRRSK